MIQMAMKFTGVSDPSSVANIGDTPLDLQAGTAAVCGRVIGVLSGIHTRERLKQEPHTQLLNSVAALLEQLR
jgi:phosphoglycolate phosphatase-like HAD superfamily hydrolase